MTDATAGPTEVSGAERFGWIAGMALLVAFTIPWFLWGNDTLVAGFPLWLWWYIGWMGLTTVVFSIFTRRAWGLGVPGAPEPGVDRGERE